MRIAQISDIHLDLRETKPHGVDVWDNFEWALDSVRENGVDMIILTGDLALRLGDDKLYDQIGARMDSLEIPYLVMPGNHDVRALFHNAFGRRYLERDGAPLDLSVDAGGIPIYLIDSGAGELEERQLAWLDMRLAAHEAAAKRGQYPSAVLLWIHHPILTGFHRYMDANYALRNSDTVRDLLVGYAERLEITVFCGHYHLENTTTERGITQLTCPSLYVQIDPAPETFRVLSVVPGYRIVELDGYARPQTGVVYRPEGAD